MLQIFTGIPQDGNEVLITVILQGRMLVFG